MQRFSGKAPAISGDIRAVSPFFEPAAANFARHSQNPAKIIDFALTFPYK
jgi:hypothetical protein